MTQKAQLQRYAEEGNPTEEPSTPVIITGGGPVIDGDAGAGQVVNIASQAALPFKVAEAGLTANTWVASTSLVPGWILQVTVGDIPLRKLSHPVVLSFRGADGQLLLEISEAGDQLGAQLTISSFDGAFEVKTPGNEPSTWLSSNISSQDAYAMLVVNDDPPRPLLSTFNVGVLFDQV